MSDARSEQFDSRLDLLEEMVSDNVRIAGDIARIDANTWAIHGFIPVDGNVLIAEFDTYEQARGALNRIPTNRVPDH